MQPGDKVRALKRNEEGIVTRLLDHEKAEVEIEEGFAIPYLISELVVVEPVDGPQEVQRESPTPEKNKQASKQEEDPVQVARGIYLAFIPGDKDLLNVYLINYTGYSLLAGLGEEKGNAYEGLFTGMLASYSYAEVTQRRSGNFEQWPPLVFNGFLHTDGPHALQTPVTRKMGFTASRFFKAEHVVPVIGSEGYLFRVDQDQFQVKPEELKEYMMEGEEKPDKDLEEKPPVPSSTVDLHIDMLTDAYRDLSNSEMLDMQMEVFTRNLDNAIANNLEEITFVHGVGNGTLRYQVHKHLSKRTDIRYFKDAQKEKFGYGATYVKVK